MITAKTARELTNNAIEADIIAKRAKAEEYCESISEEIEAESKKCKHELTIEDIPAKIYSYVICVLQGNGYAVTQLNNHGLIVIW